MKESKYYNYVTGEALKAHFKFKAGEKLTNYEVITILMYYDKKK